MCNGTRSYLVGQSAFADGLLCVSSLSIVPKSAIQAKQYEFQQHVRPARLLKVPSQTRSGKQI